MPLWDESEKLVAGLGGLPLGEQSSHQQGNELKAPSGTQPATAPRS
jgi:hypothetical protein